MFWLILRAKGVILLVSWLWKYVFLKGCPCSLASSYFFILMVLICPCFFCCFLWRLWTVDYTLCPELSFARHFTRPFSLLWPLLAQVPPGATATVSAARLKPKYGRATSVSRRLLTEVRYTLCIRTKAINGIMLNTGYSSCINCLFVLDIVFCFCCFPWSLFLYVIVYAVFLFDSGCTYWFCPAGEVLENDSSLAGKQTINRSYFNALLA